MSQDFRPFKNSNLFSNHYLEKLVKDSAQWREAEPEEAFAQIKELYQRKARVLENYNESQLEENFIRPVLRILGHHFGVQGKVLGKDRTPDYAFFPDEQSREEAEAHPGEDYYRRAVAVGDAKSWKIQLDKSRKSQGSFEMQNPSYQIDVYLRDTPPKWAILTSGRFWRLYHETTSYKLDYYYEVDLPALLAAGDIENFKYFYLFFRKEAFGQTVDAGCFLDSVREESVAYAQEIGEDLKENVYRAMKILAQGFLAGDASGAPLPDEAAVAQVQENSMRLLYRLLFIFYAESRGLLDTNNRYYYELSLQKLKTEVAARLDKGEPLLSVRYSYGEGLKNLFGLINDGSESRRIPRTEFYIPAYNGGLFDPKKDENRFLESARIGDSYLARAIDLLARSGAGRQAGFVDYSSLEIRHLGSIYEGLLEYRLCVAQQQMAAVKEKGKELWLPVGEAGKRKILDSAEAGEIYLATDKGERKATGSYYTPDYIVKYIVKNTIEPVVEKKKQEWLGTSRPFADYVLSIKVLDPAMGSGHFLVEATDQLARWLVSAWATARPEEADSKEIAEQDIHWARREVVRNCIYGVDLNPMAVELAKLSLWLTTVASNKPLSFLDHHLRCGNSLIGAELDRLAILPGGQAEQTPLWSYVLKSHTDGLLKKYSLMAALPDDNLQMVKWKEDQFRQIKESELSQRLAELSNVWLSTFFGNIVKDDDYYELQNHLSPEKFPDWGGLREKEWFTRAQSLGREKRFFHWELEFPEAFQEEGRGFDVVIGNPPYVSVTNICADNREYLLRQFSTASGRFDLYILFDEKSLFLMKNNGLFGFIQPIKFGIYSNGKNLRDLLLKKVTIERIVDVSQCDVFPDPSTYPCLLIFRELIPQNFTIIKIIKPPINSPQLIGSGSDEDVDVLEIPQFRFMETPEHIFCLRLSDKIWKFIKKTQGNSFIIKDLFNIEQLIRIGSKTKREALVLNNESYFLAPQEVKNKCRKMLDGENLDRYLIDWDGYWLHYIPKELYNPKSTEVLDASKILIKRIAPALAAVTDIGTDNGYYYPLNTIYGLIPKDKIELNLYYVTALLNSSFLDWYYKLLFEAIAIRGGYIEYREYLKYLPIRRISFTTPAPERARLGAELQQLYAEGKFAEILAQVEACLPKDGEGNFVASQEKSDVVHDLLAYLAERMLEMNKQKQQEIKGFLGWLEGYLGAKVDDLTPKTKLQSYYEHDYESFLAVLKRNSKKLAIDPARREPAEALRAEFEGSLGKLGPLRERIRQTDELIDATVYRLYGLTEEEIAIVEGRKTSTG
ncbi:MAG: Eco57I restriction-modification methylase domain-containing protein [Methanothrix sp.]|nr:Eco57I restriction-modification methylase domain-containing protein [Methanothrix sp.]